MLNVQITKRRENATADKSNVNPLFIAREVKASIHPTSQGNTSEVIVPTICQMLVPGCSVASFIAMFL